MNRKNKNPRVGETSKVIADELRAILRRSEFEKRLRGSIEAQLKDKYRNEAWKKELDEKLPSIKERYPNITKEEVQLLPEVELNKLSIGLCERLIKSYKEMLQDVFKNGKNWKCSEEDLDWYKSHLREEKNSLEVYHKKVVARQIEAKWQKSFFD